MYLRILVFLFFISTLANAQIYNPQKTNWHDAGYRGVKPTFNTIVNILHFGADNSGIVSCNKAFDDAVNSLNGAPGVVFFPAGQYFFDTSISINRDSLVLRGAGYDSSTLHVDLGHRISNLINIQGSVVSGKFPLNSDAIRGINSANMVGILQPEQWVEITMNDSSFMTSTWAYRSLAQTMQVATANALSVVLKSPFRFNYLLKFNPSFQVVLPRNNIGFECLKIQRTDATAGQASNIVFERAVNCWVNGIESDSANFAHIEINHSSNIEVTNSYFHDAFAYGGNGQGYGVLLQFGTGECLVAANYFNHLRHSMLAQAGANGNVLAYNYSTHPFWTEPNLPDSAAGEIVMHGNFPFFNLAEGNLVNNIVVDDSHGKNGPLNTFFRNRASGYGIFMNFNPATDSQQFIGNEISNANIGFNFINGSGHFLFGNNYRGVITTGSDSIPDTSLYLTSGTHPACFSGYSGWPVVGRPGGLNKGTIYAKSRVEAGSPAACDCVNAPTNIAGVLPLASGWVIYPNPATEQIEIKGIALQNIAVFDLAGRLLWTIERPANNIVSLKNLVPGMYVLRLSANGKTEIKKIAKR